MGQERYKVILKGGPLHNLVKPYTFELDERPMEFDDYETMRNFKLENGRTVTSTAPMRHAYIPTRMKDEDGNIVYFYLGTEVGQRTLEQVHEKAVHKEETKRDHESDNGPGDKQVQKVETGNNS